MPSPHVPSGPVLTPKQLAKRWKLNYRTVLNRIRDGTIPSFRVGYKIRVPFNWVVGVEAAHRIPYKELE